MNNKNKFEPKIQYCFDNVLSVFSVFTEINCNLKLILKNNLISNINVNQHYFTNIISF